MELFDDVTISEKTKIGKNVRIGRGSIIHPNVEISDNVFIGPYCIIGEPGIKYYENPDTYVFKKTVIGSNSIIRSHSVVYEDVIIGQNFQTGHRVTIREDSFIGDNVSVGTLCDLQGKLKIGNFVRLHSNVHLGQYTIIEDYVWVYPYVVTTNDPYPPMGKLTGVILKEYSQVATGSIVMPGKIVGKNALIGAMTLVNKDVSEERVIVGVPGQDRCSVRELKDNNDETIYPWKENLKDYRGYPWQKK